MGLQVSDNYSLTLDYMRVLSASGFNQYGLYHDDALYENDDVKEALKRVTQVYKMVPLFSLVSKNIFF